MEAFAKLSRVNVSPRKARLVADLVRGKTVRDGLFLLKYSQKKVAGLLFKLLKSAVSNWELKNCVPEFRGTDLFVKSLVVDCESVLKRTRPAARGRGVRILKRGSCIALVVDVLSADVAVKS